MIFRRTTSGLSNQHLFVDADAIVFLEGGESYSREAVELGHFSEISADIRFWKKIFSIYFPKGRLVFRSIGSKATVRSIALDLQNGEIENVIVAMDRDFDYMHGSQINCDNVLYSYGYSWENECWSEDAVVQAVVDMAGLSNTLFNSVKGEVGALFSSFESKIRQAVKADSLMIQNGYSFFNREQPERYINVLSDGRPEVCSGQLKISFADSRKKLGRPIRRKTSLANNPLYDCFGHLVACFSYRVLMYFLKYVYDLPTLAKHYASAAIVDKFALKLSTGSYPDINEHYVASFAGVTI